MSFLCHITKTQFEIVHTCTYMLWLLALVLTFAPISAIEKKLAKTPIKSPNTSFKRRMLEKGSAWFIDAALFAVPAGAIIFFIFATTSGVCLDPQQSIPDLRDDLIGTPSNMVVKCFLTALNPFLFFFVQVMNLSSLQQTPASDPYTNPAGQLLRLYIELVFPIALFMVYRNLSAIKYGNSLGRAVIGISPRKNDEREEEGEERKIEQLIPQANKNRLFAIAVLCMLIVTGSEVFRYEDQIARIDAQTNLAQSRFRTASDTESIFLACLSLLDALKNLLVDSERLTALQQIEVEVSKTKNRNLLMEIKKQEGHTGKRGMFGFVPKFYGE